MHTTAHCTDQPAGRRMSRLLSLLMLLSLLAGLPLTSGAQVPTEETAALLLMSATPADDPFCPSGTLVYRLTLLATGDAAGGPSQASITMPIPQDTTFVAHNDASGLTYDSSSNQLTWTPMMDPARPPESPPTAVYSVTVSAVLTDGDEIIGTASGTFNTTTPLTAQASAVVGCASEVPIDPADYPASDPVELEQEEPVEDPMLATPLPTESTEPATETLVTEPEFIDLNPPGGSFVYLPQLRTAGTAPGMMAGPPTAEAASLAKPVFGLPSCDTVPPWGTRYQMTEATYLDHTTTMNNAGFRPISITANGTGSDTRYTAIWVKDGRYTNNWVLRHSMSSSGYQSEYETWTDAGYEPLMVDIHGSTASPRYAAIWVKETRLTGAVHDRGRDNMNQEIANYTAAGFRPLWVSGLGSTSHDSPIFAGLWVKDVMTGTMRLDLTVDDIGSLGVARSMANQGYRMTHLSGYDTSEGVRYAAVWTKGDGCEDARWEAFRSQSITSLYVKGSVQTKVSEVKTVASAAITIKASEIGSYRIARVSLRGSTSGTVELNTIFQSQSGQFKNGDTLILQAEPGQTIAVEDRAHGNIRLKSWRNNWSQPGQGFYLDNEQYRLVLQYNASMQKWVELQRNNVSPDYYWPTSIDEFGATNNRRYNSVWRAGPTNRTWRITGTPVGGDTLDAFDVAMQEYMQRRNVPNGALGITVNGKLVLARGYTWMPSKVPAIQPDARFRLASVSKPLTAIAVMKLIQNGQLGYETKIKDIPGFDTILQSSEWTDDSINKVTIRHLLEHTAGWDRDLSFDPMIMDWLVCSHSNPDALPTSEESILAFMRTQYFDHLPGYAYGYSNFGYMLLGLIIEHVTGQSYGAYVQNNVLNPVGADRTLLGANHGLATGEVEYYRPDNAMGSSVMGFGFGAEADRQVCNPSHAVVVHSSYGAWNIDPMAAHGAWVSTVVDLARIMVGVEQDQLLAGNMKPAMWSRPSNRAQRTFLLDGDTGKINDVTLHARDGVPGMTLTMNHIQDAIVIGRGKVKFGQVTVDLNQAGAGFEPMIWYSRTGGLMGVINGEDDLVDGTVKWTTDGKLTFTVPDNWDPVVLEGIDTTPRYYLMILNKKTPTTPAIINTLSVGGEHDYGLGWGVKEHTSLLHYNKRTSIPMNVGNTIYGEKSKATAKINLIQPYGTGVGQLTLTNVVGGPFIAGEKLILGNQTVAYAVNREYGKDVTASHGGMLYGTRTHIQHRSDGVSFFILFNQDNTFDPYWYLPNDDAIFGRIDKLAGQFTAGGDWPAWDLFGQYPKTSP